MKTSVRAECRPELTDLDERRARREREHLGQEVAQRVVHRDRAVGARDPDVHVETERVVAPDDVAKDLVVSAVVRRVDDPLVLPAAPRMRPGAAERELQLARDAVDLGAPLAHRGRGLAEVLAPAGAHLDLGCDQLADDVRCEIGLERRGVELLEAIGERERVRIEQRELLFDGEREVGAGLEVVAALRDQLLPGDALLVAHSRESVAVPVAPRQGRAAARRCSAHDQRSTTACRADCRSASWSAGESARSSFELAGEIGGIAGLERREVAEALGILLLEPGRDLRESRVPGDERRRARRRRPRRRPFRTPRGRSTARRSTSASGSRCTR